MRLNDRVQFGVHKGNFGGNGIETMPLFTKISFFFDWIANTTSLELPKCKDQAPIHFV